MSHDEMIKRAEETKNDKIAEMKQRNCNVAHIKESPTSHGRNSLCTFSKLNKLFSSLYLF